MKSEISSVKLTTIWGWVRDSVLVFLTAHPATCPIQCSPVWRMAECLSLQTHAHQIYVDVTSCTCALIGAKLEECGLPPTENSGKLGIKLTQDVRT